MIAREMECSDLTRGMRRITEVITKFFVPIVCSPCVAILNIPWTGRSRLRRESGGHCLVPMPLPQPHLGLCPVRLLAGD